MRRKKYMAQIQRKTPKQHEEHRIIPEFVKSEALMEKLFENNRSDP